LCEFKFKFEFICLEFELELELQRKRNRKRKKTQNPKPKTQTQTQSRGPLLSLKPNPFFHSGPAVPSSPGPVPFPPRARSRAAQPAPTPKPAPAQPLSPRPIPHPASRPDLPARRSAQLTRPSPATAHAASVSLMQWPYRSASSPSSRVSRAPVTPRSPAGVPSGARMPRIAAAAL